MADDASNLVFFAAEGVAPARSCREIAGVMLLTGFFGYLIVEIPALVYMDDDQVIAAKALRPFAWFGAVFCTAMFVGYLVLQFRLAQPGVAGGSSDAQVLKVAQELIANKELSLRGVLAFLAPKRGQSAGGAEQPLAENHVASMEERLRALAKPFFIRYDVDRSGELSPEEFAAVLSDVGERVPFSELQTLFDTIDVDGSGTIDYEECIQWLAKLVLNPDAINFVSQEQPMGPIPTGRERTRTNFPTFRERTRSRFPTGRERTRSHLSIGQDQTDAMEVREASLAGPAEEEKIEEEPEMPTEIRDLPPAEQHRRVLRDALRQTALGTLIVCLFTDPMVGVIKSIANRTGIPVFYVAFLLGPLARKSFKMLACYRLSSKKTPNTVSIALVQLLGAACMNNTLCLGVFYFLVASRGLYWQYHAEVFGILLAEVLVFCVACSKVQLIWVHGVVVFLVMPFSLMFVVVLKATVFKGIDS